MHCFAVKEVRSNISDDFDKATLENKILVRLNLANNPNIVRQVDFFRDLGKQTTHLVMEALNGLTLLETLTDETQGPEDLDKFLLGDDHDKLSLIHESEEEMKDPSAP